MPKKEMQMDWNKVAAKLRATADQHGASAQHNLTLGKLDAAERQLTLSEIFYGLAVAFEAGLGR